MAGFVKLHRGWRDCEVFAEEPCTEREAWLWLIENAAWKEVARNTATGGIVTLERGQISASLQSLATAWGWSKKRVRGFLSRLEQGHMIGNKRGTGRGTASSIITICNYEKYQGEGHGSGTDEGTDRARLGHTQEESKESKEDKNGGGAAFAFFGKTIRLNDRDLAQWQSVYHAIPDFTAELTTLDAWWQGQDDPRPKNWFYRTSQMLNRKHQELIAGAKAEAADEDRFTGPC